MTPLTVSLAQDLCEITFYTLFCRSSPVGNTPRLLILWLTARGGAPFQLGSKELRGPYGH